MDVTYADVAAAHERIKPYAKRTPVLTSSTIDALTGARVHFKCENFQRMGAFKFRGAYNALSQLAPGQKRQGVVAFSSGNHAQAVALAGKLLGVPATIVMPTDAPKVKLDATRGYGAEIVTYNHQTLIASGLGAYIAQATATGNFPEVLLGVSVMSLFVVLVNRLFWRRLYHLAETRYTL